MPPRVLRITPLVLADLPGIEKSPARRGGVVAIIALLTACSVATVAEPDRCQSVPRSTLDAIEQGLTVAGTSLSGGGAMQAGKWWYVAAEIDGPGMEDDGEVGVWAVPDPADPGPIIAVDGFARNFSDWGSAGEIETLEQTLGVSRADALDAQDCA